MGLCGNGVSGLAKPRYPVTSSVSKVSHTDRSCRHYGGNVLLNPAHNSSDPVPSKNPTALQREICPTVAQKIFYSLGQAAQTGGFDTAVGFVFFYYTVVLGLSGALVGAALAVEIGRAHV